MFLLDFYYVHFSEKEAHNFDMLVDYLPWTIFTGCPKKRTFRILKVCGLPLPVLEEGSMPKVFHNKCFKNFFQPLVAVEDLVGIRSLPVKQGHVPSNPVSQKGNSEGAFFGTPFSFK